MKFGADLAITNGIVIVVGFLIPQRCMREGLSEGCVGRRRTLSCFLPSSAEVGVGRRA